MAGSNSPTNAPGSAAVHRTRNARRESGSAMAPIARSDHACHAVSSAASMEGHGNGQQAAPHKVDHRQVDDHPRSSPQTPTTTQMQRVWCDRSTTRPGPHPQLGSGRTGHHREHAVVLPSLSRREDQTGTGSRPRPSASATRRALQTATRPRTTPRPALGLNAQTPHGDQLLTQTPPVTHVCLLRTVSSQLSGHLWGCPSLHHPRRMAIADAWIRTPRPPLRFFATSYRR
jgi:hypothetical protein